jgi:16S rRNA (cytosine1402-N4)-methyltransferase
MKSGNAEGEVDKDFYGNITRPWTLVNKKPIEPGSEEISANPRSRSAKLRVAEKNEPKS